MNNQTRAAICAIINVATYEVTAIEEWVDCYNVCIRGAGWRFVSKAAVNAHVRSIQAYRQ